MSDASYRIYLVIGMFILAAGLFYSHYRSNQNSLHMLCDSHVMMACKQLGK